MARRGRNQGNGGQRSPAAEEQKANDDEVQDDRSNGVDEVFAQVNGGGVHGGGNSGGVQAGQQRGRDVDDLGQHERNVRQNVGTPHPD